MSWDPALLGGLFQVRDGSVSTVGTVPQQVVPANPQRVFLSLTGLGTTCVIRPNTGPSGNIGLQLTANGARVELSTATHGPLPQQQFMVQNAAGGTVYFIEVLKTPTGD